MTSCTSTCPTGFAVTSWTCNGQAKATISGTTAECYNNPPAGASGSGECTRMGDCAGGCPPLTTSPISCIAGTSVTSCNAQCPSVPGQSWVVNTWTFSRGSPTVSGSTAQCYLNPPCGAQGSGTCKRAT